MLICEVRESGSTVATGKSEKGLLEATSCHPSCSSLTENGRRGRREPEKAGDSRKNKKNQCVEEKGTRHKE